MASIDFYRDRLRVNRHRLDEELAEHSQRLEEIGRECARLNRAVDRARADRDITLARLVKRVKEADPKATVPVIESHAALDPGVVGANELLRDAQEEHALWEALNRAWYQRGFDLKALGELYAAQYFVVDSVTGPGPGERRKQADETVRRAMRDASAAVDARSGSAAVEQFRRIGLRAEEERAAAQAGVRRRGQA